MSVINRFLKVFPNIAKAVLPISNITNIAKPVQTFVKSAIGAVPYIAQKAGEKMEDVGFGIAGPQKDYEEKISPMPKKLVSLTKFRETASKIKETIQNAKSNIANKMIDYGTQAYIFGSSVKPENTQIKQNVQGSLNLSPTGQKEFGKEKIIFAGSPSSYNYAAGIPQNVPNTNYGMSFSNNSSVVRGPKYHELEFKKQLQIPSNVKLKQQDKDYLDNITKAVAVHEFSHSVLAKNPEIKNSFLSDLDGVLQKDKQLNDFLNEEFVSRQMGYSWGGKIGDKETLNTTDIYNNLSNENDKYSFLDELYATVGEYYGYYKPINVDIPQTVQQEFPQFNPQGKEINYTENPRLRFLNINSY